VNVGGLVRNWWMMAVRGGLALAFGLAVLVWPGVTLPVIVMLFAAYAVADGLWTIATVSRTSTKLSDGWPVLLGGAVSVGLGVLAVLWPLVPRQFVHLLAGWGIATGVLEIVAAFSILPSGAGRWLLFTGGSFSLFLAFLVLLLPYAHLDAVVHLIAGYAELYGLVVLLAAIHFARARAGSARYAETRG
jgi:uncharacterized membrane protein HdeD (DUF308 family)